MPKRKQVEVENNVVDDTVLEPEKPIKKIKTKSKTNPKDTDSDRSKSCKELCDLFALYMHLFKRSRNFFSVEITRAFFNPYDDSGELSQSLDVINFYQQKFKDEDTEPLINIAQYKSQAQNAKLGFNNDIITKKLLPTLKIILDKLINTSDKEITTTSFIKLVEENMQIISDNYKGNISDKDNSSTTELLSYLIDIYEQAWSQTFLKQSNFISSKDYIMAASNRIHALYWHIKPSVTSTKLEFKVKTFDF